MFATLLKNARNMVLNIVGKPPNKRHSRYRESTPLLLDKTQADGRPGLAKPSVGVWQPSEHRSAGQRDRNSTAQVTLKLLRIPWVLGSMEATTICDAGA